MEHQFCFGKFTLDKKNYTLSYDGASIHIEPKVFELLCYLIENRKCIVSKSEIIEKIWQGRSVSDAAVSSCIKNIRLALSSKDKSRQWIRTVYGRGVVFDGELEVLTNNVTVLKKEIHKESKSFCGKTKIVVLPFARKSKSSLGDFSAECIAEELHTTLCRLKSFFVISRASVAKYEARNDGLLDIISRLDVKYLIDGTVFVSGKQIQIHINLINARDEICIWSKIFNGSAERIFDINSDIVHQIVRKIAPAIRRSEIMWAQRTPPEKQGAYELVLQAQPYLWQLSKEANDTAASILARALKLQPNYGLALAMESWRLAQNCIYAWIAPENIEGYRSKCINLARRALNEDNEDPVLLTAFGTALTLTKNFEEAEKSISRATEIDSNHSLAWNRKGWISGYRSRPNQSLEEFQQALELSPFDPMNFNCYFGIAQAHFLNNNYSQASYWIEKALEQQNDMEFIHRLRAACHFYEKNFTEAKKSVHTILRLNPDITATQIGNLVPFERKADSQKLVDGLIGAGMPI